MPAKTRLCKSVLLRREIISSGEKAPFRRESAGKISRLNMMKARDEDGKLMSPLRFFWLLTFADESVRPNEMFRGFQRLRSENPPASTCAANPEGAPQTRPAGSAKRNGPYAVAADELVSEDHACERAEVLKRQNGVHDNSVGDPCGSMGRQAKIFQRTIVIADNDNRMGATNPSPGYCYACSVCLIWVTRAPPPRALSARHNGEFCE